MSELFSAFPHCHAMMRLTPLLTPLPRHAGIELAEGDKWLPSR